MAEAARRMSVTPTALAQRIKALEREFGVPLFSRSGRYVRITEGGARLLTQARRFQRELQDLKAAVLSEGFPGGLSLGTIRTALTNLLPEMLKHIVARYPTLDVNLEIGASHALYQMVAAGKIDAALIVEPPFKIPKSFTWHPLKTERLMLLAPIEQVDADPDEVLAHHPFLRYDRRTWGGLLADQYLQERGVTPQERYEMDSPDGIALLVSLGFGVSLVPACFRPGALPANVALIALPGNPLSRRLGLLWPARSPYCRLLQMMVESPYLKAQNNLAG